MLKKAVATSVVLLLAVATAQAQGKGGKVEWRTDPQKAMAEAKEKGLGMMLYFTSEG